MAVTMQNRESFMQHLRNELEGKLSRMEITSRQAQGHWEEAQRKMHDEYDYYSGSRHTYNLGPESFTNAKQRVARPAPAPAPPPFDPNTIESLNVDIETLTGLWLAKFGTKWVKDADLGENAEPFWFHAFKRLRLHSRFESYSDWSKLKETPNVTV